MTSQKISVNLPDRVVESVEEELVGTIGRNRSDAIATALAIYLSERGLLEGGP